MKTRMVISTAIITVTLLGIYELNRNYTFVYPSTVGSYEYHFDLSNGAVLANPHGR